MRLPHVLVERARAKPGGEWLRLVGPGKERCLATAARLSRTHSPVTIRAAKNNPQPAKKLMGIRHPSFAWNSGTRFDAAT